MIIHNIYIGLNVIQKSILGTCCQSTKMIVNILTPTLKNGNSQIGVYCAIRRIFMTLICLLVISSPSPAYDRQDHQKLMTTGNCRNCDLSRADFSGHNFANSDLRGANLSFVNFRKASLIGADLFGAILDQTDFSGAVWLDGDRCLEGSVDECIKR